MYHGHARTAIAGILEGNGFDLRAQALVHAAHIAGDPYFGKELGEQLMEAARGLPRDDSNFSHAPALSAPVPDDQQALVKQLISIVTDHPQAIARQIASLQQLVELWPNANRDERSKLRLYWLGSLASRTDIPGSYVTRRQLREWQRDLPTVHEEGSPCASALAAMLEHTSPQAAYASLSLYLGADADLPTLAWTLGVLTEQVLLHHFDAKGRVIQALVGTISCEKLVAYSPPETLLTLVSQLAHHIWWCAKQSKPRSLRPSREDHIFSLSDAVRQGDIYAAEKAARMALHNREAFWSEVACCLQHISGIGHYSWATALAAITAVRYRGGEQAVLSPDDAATVGAALATAQYRADNQSQRLEPVS